MAHREKSETLPEGRVSVETKGIHIARQTSELGSTFSKSDYKSDNRNSLVPPVGMFVPSSKSFSSPSTGLQIKRQLHSHLTPCKLTVCSFWKIWWSLDL